MLNSEVLLSKLITEEAGPNPRGEQQRLYQQMWPHIQALLRQHKSRQTCTHQEVQCMHSLQPAYLMIVKAVLLWQTILLNL